MENVHLLLLLIIAPTLSPPPTTLREETIQFTSQHFSLTILYIQWLRKEQPKGIEKSNAQYNIQR
jgi:hypothetical protein